MSSIGIRAENIYWNIHGRPLLCDLHAEFHPGTTTAIVGPNGSGKSTFLKLLAGQLSPSQGRVRYRALNPAKNIALLPTHNPLNLEAPLLLRDLIQMAFFRKYGLFHFGRLPAKDLEDLDSLTKKWGLAPFLDQTLSTLSSGQLQKALILRLILENPSAILLDEPFNTLDATSTQILLNQIHEWERQGKIILVVSHQYDLVLQNFAQTLFLSPQYVAQGPTRFVLGNAPQEIIKNTKGPSVSTSLPGNH